jgi:hypothetical protein
LKTALDNFNNNGANQTPPNDNALNDSPNMNGSTPPAGDYNSMQPQSNTLGFIPVDKDTGSAPVVTPNNQSSNFNMGTPLSQPLHQPVDDSTQTPVNDDLDTTPTVEVIQSNLADVDSPQLSTPLDTPVSDLQAVQDTPTPGIGIQPMETPVPDFQPVQDTPTPDFGAQAMGTVQPEVAMPSTAPVIDTPLPDFQPVQDTPTPDFGAQAMDTVQPEVAMPSTAPVMDTPLPDFQPVQDTPTPDFGAQAMDTVQPEVAMPVMDTPLPDFQPVQDTPTPDFGAQAMDTVQPETPAEPPHVETMSSLDTSDSAPAFGSDNISSESLPADLSQPLPTAVEEIPTAMESEEIVNTLGDTQEEGGENSVVIVVLVVIIVLLLAAIGYFGYQIFLS